MGSPFNFSITKHGFPSLTFGATNTDTSIFTTSNETLLKKMEFQQQSIRAIQHRVECIDGQIAGFRHEMNLIHESLKTIVSTFKKMEEKIDKLYDQLEFATAQQEFDQIKNS